MAYRTHLKDRKLKTSPSAPVRHLRAKRRLNARNRRGHNSITTGFWI